MKPNFIKETFHLSLNTTSPVPVCIDFQKVDLSWQSVLDISIYTSGDFVDLTVFCDSAQSVWAKSMRQWESKFALHFKLASTTKHRLAWPGPRIRAPFKCHPTRLFCLRRVDTLLYGNAPRVKVCSKISSFTSILAQIVLCHILCMSLYIPKSQVLSSTKYLASRVKVSQNSDFPLKLEKWGCQFY